MSELWPMQRALPSSRGQRGDCDLGAAGPSSHTPAIPGRGSRPEGCFCRRGKGSWRALGGVWAPWESRGCWRAASAPHRVTPPSPPPPSPVSPPIPAPERRAWLPHIWWNVDTGCSAGIQGSQGGLGDWTSPTQWEISVHGRTHSPGTYLMRQHIGTGGEVGGIGKVLGRPGMGQSPCVPSLVG